NNGPLPFINTTLVIDGTAQTGGAANATVHLNSKAANDVVNGFLVQGTAASSIVRNIVMRDDNAPNNFNAPPSGEYGVKVTAAGGAFTLQNVAISGIDGDGVDIISSPNNVIGGSGATQGLLITANNGHGVHI